MTPKTDPKPSQKVVQKWVLKRDSEIKSGKNTCIKTHKGTAENEDWVSLTVLDVSWASLRPLLASLGFSWTLLGVSLATLGVSWTLLGHSWATLGALLGLSLLPLGLSWASLGLSWPPLGLSWASLGAPRGGPEGVSKRDPKKERS